MSIPPAEVKESKFPSLPAEVKAKILKDCETAGKFSKISKADDDIY